MSRIEILTNIGYNIKLPKRGVFKLMSYTIFFEKLTVVIYNL